VAAAGKSAYLFRMRTFGLFLLAVGVLATPALGAGSPAPDTDPPEAVRVYTNADLEKFGPSEAPEGPVRTRDGGEWAFVQAFLDREHARLEAERDYELRRSADQERARQLANPHPDYQAPYLGLFGYRWATSFRHPGERDRRRHAHDESPAASEHRERPHEAGKPGFSSHPAPAHR
jgi:hypothetical protein